MGRKVKCKITGEYGTSDDFVKIGQHYYKSQEIYDKHCEEQKYREKIVSLFCEDFLKYQVGQPCPTFLFKKLKELNFYSNEIILKTIEQNYSTIKYYSENKEFRNDVQKISYIFAIINNRISEVYKTEERKKTAKRSEKIYEKKLSDVAATLNIEKEPKASAGRLSQRNISEFFTEGVDGI